MKTFSIISNNCFIHVSVHNGSVHETEPELKCYKSTIEKSEPIQLVGVGSNIQTPPENKKLNLIKKTTLDYATV